MSLKWDNKVGAAAIIGLSGSLSILVAIGIAWGSMNGKIDAAALEAKEAKSAAESVSKASDWRDKKVNDQAIDISSIKTTLTFLVPALVRIEAKLDAKK